MDKLKKKLLELKEALSKGMNNSGLGGPGSVKRLGAVKPSIQSITSAGKSAGNNSATSSLGITQPSKKNPLKQAQQTQNKDIKDIKMKEAQAKLSINKGEVLRIDPRGQWTIEKSGYKGYDLKDNIKRKMNNIEEGATEIQTMNRKKKYGGSGANADARAAAKLKAKSKKNPVKEYTPEEIAAFEVKRKKEGN